MFNKILAITGLAAILAVPTFSFAEEGKGKEMREEHRKEVFDKTAVSIAIANDGSVLVRGAKVTDVDSSGLTATTVVNGVTMTWDINTDGDTTFFEADGDAMLLADIADDHLVSFSGKLTSSYTVDVDTVRDWSVDETEGGEEHDNGQKNGFWNKLKTWPMFSFWAKAKVEAE